MAAGEWMISKERKIYLWIFFFNEGCRLFCHRRYSSVHMDGSLSRSIQWKDLPIRCEEEFWSRFNPIPDWFIQTSIWSQMTWSSLLNNFSYLYNRGRENKKNKDWQFSRHKMKQKRIDDRCWNTSYENKFLSMIFIDTILHKFLLMDEDHPSKLIN